jgi:hypothetical protein
VNRCAFTKVKRSAITTSQRVKRSSFALEDDVFQAERCAFTECVCLPSSISEFACSRPVESQVNVLCAFSCLFSNRVCFRSAFSVSYSVLI